MDYHFAGLSECFVAESGCADFEGVPLGAEGGFVDVDYVEMFILESHIHRLAWASSIPSKPTSLSAGRKE